MPKGKWIHGTSPHEPFSAAAREVLRARLRTVSYYLSLAAFKSHRDVEYVHQLRVSTRRSMAAVRLFASVLAPGHEEWLARKLKKIRSAANEARDCDVLGSQIARWAEARPTPGRTALVGRLEQLRDAAQQPILKIERKLHRRNFSGRVDKIVKRLRWRGAPPEPSFAAAAAESCRSVMDAFFAATTGVHDELAALHRFRIAAKHLRYSMEIFVPAFETDFRTVLYPAIEEVQSRLGELNDHASAIERFQSWVQDWNDTLLNATLEELIQAEEQALAVARDKFGRWWTADRAADLRRRFDQLIVRSAAADEKSA